MILKREDMDILLQACIEDLFEALGIDPTNYHNDGTVVRGPCPCHDSDNRSAFVYYFNRGIWFCWTGDCNKKAPGRADLVGLVGLRLEKDTIGARKWVGKFLADKGMTSKDVAIKLRGAERRKDKKIDHWREHLMQKPFSDELLSSLAPPREFAELRKIDLDVLKGMGVGRARGGMLRNRIIFPVRNIDGKITGFTCRHPAIDGKPKWWHWPAKKFRSAINLFNIDKAAKHIRRTGAVIIGEGPLEVVKLEMAGYRNSVCVFGLRITSGHIEILKKCGTIYTILAFDPDRVESSQVKDNISRLQSSDFDVRVLRWDGDEDIGAMEVSKVHRVMSQVREVPTFHEWRSK